MALLFALNIADGKRTFSQVPKMLKEAVKEQLILMGLGELAEEKSSNKVVK